MRSYTSILGSSKNTILNTKLLQYRKPLINVHPTEPARTRFAPSPTGFLHLGSLRTALYNYLLAKNTGGQFILRLEDTDRKRLVHGAEQNIYDSLEWCGIKYDEGPGVNEIYGPYRQSERTHIYKIYADKLLESGNAYRCFCSKERLDLLKESAQRLHPPTNVTYDRHCANLSTELINKKLQEGLSFTIRLRSPKKYPPFNDLLHGKIDIQPQINVNDVRHDDPILIKSDSLPTYHFANVVDDHLSKITHVIRGEEWLPSTPKHIALYQAFGWNPPKFVHIPLLTTLDDKKLSKRKGDADIMSLKAKGILPEALINFSVLFGWSPPRKLASINHECFTLEEFTRLFDLNNLTKGNAKVDEQKLSYFNKHYLTKRLDNNVQFKELSSLLYEMMKLKYPNLTLQYVERVLQAVSNHLTTIYDFEPNFYYFFTKPNYKDNQYAKKFKITYDMNQASEILNYIKGKVGEENILDVINDLVCTKSIQKKTAFETIRFALIGSVPGLQLPIIIKLLGVEESNKRIEEALAKHLS